MHTFSTATIDSKADAACEPDASEEYRHWFGSLVTTHLASFMWPNSNVHRLMKARESGSSSPFAFCYYYINPDTDHCELFGLYVDPQHRSRGVATEMLLSAIAECVRNQCLSFALRFLSPKAKTGRLVGEIRNAFHTRYPLATAQVYFPSEEPYVESIGG
jgi:GNAT superfamily N-acetyltransferase